MSDVKVMAVLIGISNYGTYYSVVKLWLLKTSEDKIARLRSVKKYFRNLVCENHSKTRQIHYSTKRQVYNSRRLGVKNYRSPFVFTICIYKHL